MIDRVMVGRRREQGVLIGLVSAVLLLLVSIASGLAFLWQPDPRPRLGNIDQLAVGAVRLYEPNPRRSSADAPVVIEPIYVARVSERQLLAFAYRDPRNGCPMIWDLYSRYFIDPCHGSTYTITGEHVRGPSTRDLSQFPIQVDRDGTIIVSGGVQRGAVTH